MAIYRSTYASNPNDAKVCFACGLAMLRATTGAEGADALELAKTLDPSLAKRANALLEEFRRAWMDEDSSPLRVATP
jgi:hypothetical protein